MKVALFITCFNDALYPGTGKAVVRLLRRLGCDVEFPDAQTCCGQMHFNTGYRPEATKLACAAFRPTCSTASTRVVVTISVVRWLWSATTSQWRRGNLKSGKWVSTS